MENNIDKFECDNFNRLTYISNDLEIVVTLSKYPRARRITKYKNFFGFDIALGTDIMSYTEEITEIFVHSKYWKESFELEGGELFYSIKDSVKERKLKLYKEQLEKLCK